MADNLLADAASVPPGSISEEAHRSALEPTSTNSAANPVQDHTAVLMRLVLICSSSVVLFHSLGQQLLRTWDESIYAEVAKEMVTGHSWWTLSWNFQPWVDKPPLFMWLTALLYRCFGVSETTSRAVGVLCGIATICLTFEIGRRLMGDWGGFAAAVILLTNGYFIYATRFEAINGPLTFCYALAAYGYLRKGEGESRWWYAVGAATGMAVMLKSAAGLGVPMAVGLAVLLDRRWKEIKTREVRNSIFLACAIVLPWHVSMVVSHGRDFVAPYLASIFARAKGLDAAPKPADFYLLAYGHDFGPFALVALLGLLLHVKGQRKSSIIVSIVLAVTACFSLIGSKLVAYALPAFPFISLLAVMALTRLKTAKLSIACAVIVFPLYWFLQKDVSQLIYSDSYGYVGSINSRNEPLMRLLLQARPTDHDSSPAPLIICLDGSRFEKQQAIFYGNRPIKETFLSVPINDTEPPLEQAVGPKPSPIIIWNNLYPVVANSGKFNFRVMAQSGPLVLGQISRL